jgi:hypothetical protein
MDEKVLFFEPGASWVWVLAGPASGIAMLLIQLSTGYGLQPLVPVVFLVLVTGFVAIQVKAARIHTSVELTPTTLREGAQIIHTKEILRVFPDPENTMGTRAEVAKWQSSRALGELTGVPRGRTGIGLKLAEGRTVQAWARRHRDLRAALTDLVEERQAQHSDGDRDGQS